MRVTCNNCLPSRLWRRVAKIRERLGRDFVTQRSLKARHAFRNGVITRESRSALMDNLIRMRQLEGGKDSTSSANGLWKMIFFPILVLTFCYPSFHRPNRKLWFSLQVGLDRLCVLLQKRPWLLCHLYDIWGIQFGSLLFQLGPSPQYIHTRNLKAAFLLWKRASNVFRTHHVGGI